MARYRLHCNGGSGHSYKIALYLNCAGLDWEPVGVDFAGGQTRDPEWRARINAMGEVPVLEVDGRLMSQSGAILLWLAGTTGHFAPAADQRFEAMRWLLFDNHRFTNNFAMHRFQNCMTPRPADPAVLAFLRARGRKHVRDRGQASRGARVHARRRSDHRRFLVCRLSLVPRGGDRLRPRGICFARRLAKAAGRAAGLEAALRTDAGRHLAADTDGVITEKRILTAVRPDRLHAMLQRRRHRKARP